MRFLPVMGTLSILAQWTGTTLFDCNCTFITHTTARNTCIYDAIAMTYLVRDVIIIIHKWAAVLVFRQIGLFTGSSFVAVVVVMY